MKRIRDVIRRFLLLFIHFYQKGISPFIPASCRFQPTCSNYAKQAIERFGPLKGTWLALKRISKCHPFGDHGFDPVPEKK